MGTITRIICLGCFILSIFSFSSYAQNLLNERIWKITPRKLSKFFDKGIFHNGDSNIKSTLKGVRHSFDSRKRRERIVFDFSGMKVPRIYGYVSSKEKKVYMDFFDTKVASGVGSFGKSKFVEKINFFPLEKEPLSVEVELKKTAKFDVFYLESPGRLIIDIKNL